MRWITDSLRNEPNTCFFHFIPPKIYRKEKGAGRKDKFNTFQSFSTPDVQKLTNIYTDKYKKALWAERGEHQSSSYPLINILTFLYNNCHVNEWALFLHNNHWLHQREWGSVRGSAQVSESSPDESTCQRKTGSTVWIRRQDLLFTQRSFLS